MSRITQKPEQNFVSSDIKLFFCNRFLELLGIFCFFLAVVILLSLISYEPRDASWNTASIGEPQNLLHVLGAYIADFFLQLFGFASFILLPVLLFWGAQLMWEKGMSHPIGRLMGLVSLLLCVSVLCSYISFSDSWWPMLARGGGLGVMGQNELGHLSEIIFFPVWLSTLLLSLASIALFTLTCGIKWCTWGRCLKITGRASYWALRKIVPGRKKQAGTREDVKRKRRPPELGDRTNSFDGEEEKIIEDTQALPIHRSSIAAKNYLVPPLDLLGLPKNKNIHQLSQEELEESCKLLGNVLDDFGIKGEITDIKPGPVVTLYQLKPAPGTKSSRVVSLAEDISRSMSALSARIAVIPGYNAIGIELPNPERQTVYFRSLLEDPVYTKTSAALPLILGQNIGGETMVTDLAKMPHLLVAGTTGSGKSVSINTMILSLLYALPPEECRFIMIDPKMLELSVYDGIPHLLTPVVTDPHKAIIALKWVVREMETRYQNMARLNVRNIQGYNERIRQANEAGETITRQVQTGFDSETGEPIIEEQALDPKPLPKIVVIVDEMADLMLVAGKDIESAVQRLAQMARAAGIHLIMATQRPSVDVITGTIKANFPTRISFQVTSKIDSRTILGEQGAEQLLGQGDMLFMAPGGRITRIHGPFVSDREVEKVVQFLKSQGEPDYITEVTVEEESNLFGNSAGENEADPLFRQAVDLIQREGKASTSFIQRHLKIGYNRAAGIIDELEAKGIISPANHVGKREVLSGER